MFNNTAVDDVMYWCVHFPGEVSEKTEHCESGKDSGEEIQQRHTNCVTARNTTML